jgi:hypothetical protein
MLSIPQQVSYSSKNNVFVIHTTELIATHRNIKCLAINHDCVAMKTISSVSSIPQPARWKTLMQVTNSLAEKLEIRQRR